MNETDDAFYNKKQYDDLLEKYDDLFKEKYSIIETYLSPDLIKLELVTKEENDPMYKMSLNDFHRIAGEENKLKEDGEKEIVEYKESEINRIISEKTDLNKYRIDKNKDSKIVQVFKKPPSTNFLIYEDKDMNKFSDKEDEERLKF